MKNPLENHRSKLVILLAVCSLMICESVVVARGVGVCPVQSPDPLAEGNDRELVRRAVELAERGKPEEGIALLKKVIARSPNYLQARIQYVRIKTYYLSRYDEVRAEYDSLISRDPNNPVYTMSLAIGASRLIPGRTKNEWFEKASKMASEWPWGHYATARLISEKSPEQAASELIKCIEKDEGAIEAYAMLLSLQKNKLGK